MASATYSVGLLAAKLHCSETGLPRGLAGDRRFRTWVRKVDRLARLIGHQVRTLDGERLGWVEDVLLDASGKPVFALLGLDTPEEEIVITSWETLSEQDDTSLLHVDTVELAAV